MLQPPQTATVLIDNGYLVKILEYEFHNARLDYAAFSDCVCRMNSCVRRNTIFFDAAPVQFRDSSSRERKKYANKQRFFAELAKLPDFEVKLGKLVPYYDWVTGESKMRQKGVDVQIAVDMVAISWDPARKVDKIILIAGDGDFEPAVKYVRTLGREVVLYHSARRNKDGSKKVADALRAACDECYPLDQGFMTECFYDGRKVAGT
ncbi:NYN domain-containing protein [Methanomassiliicoccus luminyensis]|uniref:NYN domain-containing protein n=1 Tax=Methanomassiliicoccus luminyensis TaxID=1080712 RepID=UPI00036B3745|nr:NYN domain-containing protein [Methanomassiliicoccus luminyensis]